MDKGTLAAQYNPNVTQKSAVRTLNNWIRRNKELSKRLEEAYYVEDDRLLTPLQTALIKEYLGEP